MPPKRKRAEEEEDKNRTSIYASEVGWLTCLTDPSKSIEANDEVVDGEANTMLITEACKLTYILYHDIQAHDYFLGILQSLNKSGTANNAKLARVAKTTQSAWKAHIVNKFLLPHVKEIVRKWRVARPYAGFESVPVGERVKLWLQAYDADPKGTVAAMWKPVIGVVDLASIFRTDLPAKDNAKMIAVRQMLRHKYYFGCECTYKHSVADDKKTKTLEDWAAYARFEDHVSSIVPFADLPISPKTLAIVSSDRSSKKRKDTLAGDVLKSTSMSSMLDPSDVATVSSATSDAISSGRRDLAGTYESPSSLLNSRATPVVSSLPRLETQEEYAKPFSTPQGLSYLLSPETGVIHQNRKETPSLSKFFGINNGLEVAQAPSTSILVATGPITEEAQRIRDYFGIPDTSSMQAEAVPSTEKPQPVLDEDSL